ncbi:MAG TPA: hypothetical protein VGR37_15485 [Longimicrobiaceae bacterium]|nr:hypothetical protein [Longimicrobiaceae bacterium]
MDSAGRTVASVGFGRVLPDDEVQELLRRYDVRPFVVYLGVAGIPGIHEVPVEEARPELVAEARRRRAEEFREAPCHMLARTRMTMRSERDVRPAPGDRDPASRMRLAEMERLRSAPERLRRGEPAVYGLRVVGRVEELRRLASDLRVREFHWAWWMDNGGRRELYAPGINSPPEVQRPPIPPEIEALSNEEVRSRLERITREPPPECREPLRNIEANEPAVRPEPVPGTPGAYAAAGLVFHAESHLAAETGARVEAPGAQAPQTVHVALTVSNPSRERIETGIRGCTVLLRAYRTPARTGEPAWDESRGIGCAQAPMRLALGPGESRTFGRQADVWRILGESLPPGRYALAVLFRLADRTLEIPAGEVELSPRLEGLAFRAETRVKGRELHAEASVTNTTARPVYVEYGACALHLRAYRTPARAGEPAWRSERREPWEGTMGYACPSYLASHTLAPGETFSPKELRLRVPLVEVLGDSLTDGRYYFTASLRLNFRPTPEFPAGSAELSLPRPTLPSSRTADFVTYRAATDVVSTAPRTVRTRVTATLTHAGSSLLRYSADCPLVVHAYRDRARRDAAPRSGEPDWKSERSCGPGLQQMTLHRGESRTFEVRATAREILGAGLPPGRYYFAAVVGAEGRRVFLSAGEAELAR